MKPAWLRRCSRQSRRHERALAGGPLAPGYLRTFSQKNGLESSVLLTPEGAVVNQFGPVPPAPLNDPQLVRERAPVQSGGKLLGEAAVSMRVPIDIARQQAWIERNNRFYAELASSSRQIRLFYLSMMALITLFVLFFATWMAFFLAKQISVPISALLDGASEVRKGNLRYRVNVRATDELRSLVRAFNQMTETLEASSQELDAAPALHRGHPRKHSHRRHLGRPRRRHPAREPGPARKSFRPAPVAAAHPPRGSVFAGGYRRNQVHDEARPPHRHCCPADGIAYRQPAPCNWRSPFPRSKRS